jgi:hypothetical protein
MSQIHQINEEELMTVEDLLTTAKNFDKIIMDSVEAGMESGRSVGVLESYNFLVREGFDEAAEALMELVYEDEQNRKNKGDA